MPVHTTDANALRRSSRRGQTVMEYAIVVAILAVVAGVTAYFLRAPGKVAKYTTDVICSDNL